MTTYFYVRGPFMFYGSTPNYFNHGIYSYMLYIIYIFLYDLYTLYQWTIDSKLLSKFPLEAPLNQI